MSVKRVTYYSYSVKAEDALGGNLLRAGDLRALVRSLDAESVPDTAQWDDNHVLTQGRPSSREATITFRVDEELEH